MALQLEAAAAEDAPNLVGADIAQRLSQQRPVSLRVATRSRLIEQRQHARLGSQS
jgi:hypothetical protein